MRYFGGKARISKELSSFINEHYLKGNSRPFVDLFCGSCNITTKIDKNREVIANDKHKYLIAMWKELQNGWIPPRSCTNEQWRYVRENQDIKPHVSGFIGFSCSFGGRWFEGYTRGRDNKGFERNYAEEGYKGVMKKLKDLQEVKFFNLNYDEVPLPTNSVVYCDIPYKNTIHYNKKEVGIFDHEKFYSWCKENKNSYTILISEFEHNVPDDFEIVWRKENRKSIANKLGEFESTMEILMTPK